ncbi:MAG: PAS domain-containing protein [Deltaproteobacteria bacterium]|nr:PAS domain-containing protein [Deltaproteobacteria bacterium]
MIDLQTIFDNIGDGIFVIDKDYQIQWVNRGLVEFFNRNRREPSDLIGKRCFVEYYRSDSICNNCPAQKTFEEGRSWHITKICRGIDRGRMVLGVSTFPIKDNDGLVIQVIGYIKSLTEMARLEDQLLYQERLAGIGELAAGVAHEIRNPLGNIAASAQFCLNKYRLERAVRKHMRVILRSSKSANRIIKDLLDFARPSDVSFKMADIGRVIDRTCNLVKARCSRQRIRLVRRWSRRLPQILIDEKGFEEAFLNIILNALDAMPDGGRLSITAYPQDDEIVISFSDTGNGIPQENLGRIFNPFFTTKENGVGLGLCLALQVVSCHKGRIDIESKVDEGTEVVVRVPICRKQ